MPKKYLYLLIFILFMILSFPQKAYAYLDPGSGSYLTQIIIASLAGFGFFLKTNWQKIKNFFKKRAKNEKK